MRFLWFWACGCAVLCSASPPVKVWVELRDKGPGSAQGRAGEDAPLYPPYLNQLRTAGFAPDVSLKWQNRVSGWIDSSKWTSLEDLPAVRRVELLPRKFYRRPPRAAPAKPLAKIASSSPTFGAFQTVFDATQASALSAAVTGAGEVPGQGLRIAVIDADFLLGHEAFAQLWQGGQVVDQWDFARNRSTAVYDSLGDSHGAAVLSLLAGRSGSVQGLVPAAKYLLYIAQNNDTEFYDEEDWVAAAIERAVDSGAQVINISLSDRFDYQYPANDSAPDSVDYNVPYADMNGRTRPSSLAALGAARRGVLVSVAVGNEGPVRDGGPTVTAPADADSILSVGILDATQRPCSYSSTGPTADGRIKPELTTIGPDACASPTVNPATPANTEDQGGTSFAAPVVAGIAALLRQLHPSTPAQTIRLALMSTASRTLHPDSAAGYGLVRAADANRILSANSSVKGALVWERGNAPVYLRWQPGLDFSTLRLWDLRGRAIPGQAAPAAPIFGVDPGSARAAGVYVWKIQRDASSP